jgi:hypothetical protein
MTLGLLFDKRPCSAVVQEGLRGGALQLTGRGSPVPIPC